MTSRRSCERDGTDRSRCAGSSSPSPMGGRALWESPRVRDRVVQAAVKIVIEPLFEASFRPGSFGFRPKRGVKQAIETIRQGVNRGQDEVIDLDLKSYFDTIDQDLLMRLVRRRVSDPRVLRLIRRWLRAGVMLDGRPKGQVGKCIVVLRQFLETKLRLTINEEKTRLTTAQDGFDFLGVHFRKAPGRRDPRRSWCYAWPSCRSMKRIRSKVRTALGRDKRPSLQDKIRQLNPILRGWGNYFRMLNSSEQFRKLDQYTWWKFWRWLRRKHDGRWSSTSPIGVFLQEAGLHVLSGTVVYAR